MSELVESLQREIELHRARTEALACLPRLHQEKQEADFLQAGMEIIEELTGSRISFVHFVHEGGREIELVTWSRRTLDEYCDVIFDSHYPVEKAGVWADAVRQREAVVYNDYDALSHKKGLPEGHSPIQRMICVPVLLHDEVVMITGVGNKDGEYESHDVETVQLISNQMWQLTQLRRRNATLSELRDVLEDVGEIAEVGGWSLDLEADTLFWTRATHRLLGVPVDETPEIEVALSFYTPESRAILEKKLQEAIDLGRPYDLILQGTPRGGETIWVRTSGRPRIEDGRTVQILGSFQDITRYRRLEERLQELRHLERTAANRAVAVRESERQLLGRELHDSVGQLLTAIRMDIQLMAPDTEETEQPAPGSLASIARLADDSLRMIQDLSARLREPILDEIGLVPALSSYLKEYEVRSGLRCVLDARKDLAQLSPELSTAAYRIAQEAVTNVVRHSQATRVVVGVSVRDAFLEVEVADDGIGMGPEVVGAKGSIGLQGMRMRAEELGGTLEIDTDRAEGVCVRARLPVPEISLSPTGVAGLDD